MFVDVTVSESANCPMALTRIFDAVQSPTQITIVMAADPEGKDQLCNVTGWSNQGPCPAYAALVEDSGEGLAMLIYGGDEGIRLRPTSVQAGWDLSSSEEWGEACLLLDKDVKLC